MPTQKLANPPVQPDGRVGDEYLTLDAIGDVIDGTVLETRNAVFLARRWVD